MSNPELKVGDLVDITIKGARVTSVDDDDDVQLQYDGPHDFPVHMSVWANAPGVTVAVTEPAVPAEWPPQAGDLWRDRSGEVWFGVDITDVTGPNSPVVKLVGRAGLYRDVEVVHRDHGPLQLVHREQAEQPEAVWPPTAGDVWLDKDNDEWTAFNTAHGLMLRMSKDGAHYTPRKVHDQYRPLTFVRREPTR